ncbi:MAG TPA: phosphomevalonate kinase [bacterium]|nr:phosphomevalonate kinase [bacterium]
MKLTIQAPGKLILSGEWAVLEPGHPALVAAFDRYVYCDYEDSEQTIINLPDLQMNNLSGTYTDKHFSFTPALPEEQAQKAEIARQAIEAALRYLEEDGKAYKPFTISTDTIEHAITLTDGSQAKVGLGSSAGVTVTIIGTLLKVNGYDLARRATLDVIFKLAAVAHYQAQGNVGSGTDLAACTYGGVNSYTRFDPHWLIEQVDQQKPLKELCAETWPGLAVEKVTLPKEMLLFAAYSGKPASTPDMIKTMEAYKQANTSAYNELMGMISQTTTTLLAAIKDEHQTHVLNLLEANRLVLGKLGALASVPIETPELAKMAEIAKQHNGGAKLSGAGGGDCCIGIAFDQFQKEDIEWAWEEAGFYPLDVFISERGVSVWY